MSIAATSIDEDEVTWNLIASVRRVIRGRRVLLSTTLLGLALGVLLAVLLKPYYQAEAVFLPPKNTDVVPGAGAGASAALFLGGDESSDLYLGLLSSRSVQQDVIQHLDLVVRFHAQSLSLARLQLMNSSTFAVSKNAFITVNVRDPDPALAADIANGYLDALYRVNGQMVDSASAHRRAFFEEQLELQKNALAEAELDLARTQERLGIVFPAGEAQAGIAATAALQGELNAAEVRLAGLLLGGTEQNSEVVQARAQVAQLRAQLGHQQADSSASAGLASNKRLPSLALAFAQREREVRLKETVFEALVQQYEKARLSSIDPGPQLQIVDKASAPEKKAGPNRRLIVIAGAAFGLFAGLAGLLLLDPLRQLLLLLRGAPLAREE